MANALDTFREQRAAAGGVYAALRETSELVRGLQSQVNALTRIDELKTLLQEEDRWLHEAQRVVAEMRRLRDEEVAVSVYRDSSVSTGVDLRTGVGRRKRRGLRVVDTTVSGRARGSPF